MKPAIRIKICGMKSTDDIKKASICGADAVGFIVDVPVDTPRKINIQKAAELIHSVPLFMDSVLVIMPDSGVQAVSMVETVRPDIVQIHGNINADDLEYMKNRLDIPIVKTCSVPVGNSESSSGVICEFENTINNLKNQGLLDAILLDSKTDTKSGGSGTVHNWEISKTIMNNVDIPVILAGGLNPDNVKEAVQTVFPYAVDVASGVETNNTKDIDKIHRFIHEARNA
ncbi:Phosphoribosylanthranilate isomerase [Methanohalobium evestigatum Z-7303]|uniref:N-(5'-phosphoribosyl)anthranilate isomerase n=1 Tax=Methanohalobium evestigatum (strain ATCC BAA-1072 / DSM 3721 / NBRC 107634 / OCM 161 / Z-7303) TaxID=644295 RepID=D7EBJ0_METEZ|nr:phosphoribosylanthranilate isomerase [Methanohalobium evestigatum]ADI74832.1 Phosphoribosylanthranilate isomerase [Methanohalobium evestigatum Z-7303]